MNLDAAGVCLSTSIVYSTLRNVPGYLYDQGCTSVQEVTGAAHAQHR